MIASVQSLSVTQLEELGKAVLDFTAIQDLRNWLEANRTVSNTTVALCLITRFIFTYLEDFSEFGTPGSDTSKVPGTSAQVLSFGNDDQELFLPIFDLIIIISAIAS